MPGRNKFSASPSASIAPSDSASHGDPDPAPAKFSSSTKKRPMPTTDNDTKPDLDGGQAKKARRASGPNKAKGAEDEERESKGGAKARLGVEAKQFIAEEIVRRGVAALDVPLLAQETGLSITQIRSQIADNRMNLRRQLMNLIQTIQ